jgi:RNA polymerase primary sigma factor
VPTSDATPHEDGPPGSPTGQAGHPALGISPKRASKRRVQEELAREIARSPAFKAYLDDVAALLGPAGPGASRLSARREAELAARIAEGDRRALEELVTANLPLVYGIAVLYSGLGVPLQDLVQEGNIGLLRAAQKYRPVLPKSGRRVRFTTHASWWVWQAVGRAVPSQGRTIELPVHVDIAMQKLRRLRERAERRGEDLPDLATLAAETGESEARLQAVLSAPTTTSLYRLGHPAPDASSAYSGAGSAYSWADILPAPQPEADAVDDVQASGPEAHALLEEERTTLARVWSQAGLTTREAAVLTLRFGLDERGARPVAVVAAALKIAPNTVFKEQRSALRKLRLQYGISGLPHAARPRRRNRAGKTPRISQAG